MEEQIRPMAILLRLSREVVDWVSGQDLRSRGDIERRRPKFIRCGWC